MIFFKLVHNQVLSFWNFIHKLKVRLNLFYFVKMILGFQAFVVIFYFLVLFCNLLTIKVFSAFDYYFPKFFNFIFFHELLRYYILRISAFLIIHSPSIIFESRNFIQKFFSPFIDFKYTLLINLFLVQVF